MGQAVKGLFNSYFNQGYTLFHSLEIYFSLWSQYPFVHIFTSVYSIILLG